MNEQVQIVIEITTIAVPLVCAGCGKTSKDAHVKAFGLQTSYLGSSRQIVAYCQPCSEDLAILLLRSW